MSVQFLLLSILFILMAVIGGKRGLKAFFSLWLNFLTLFMMLILISLNIDPLKITILGSIIIGSITLFYINGVNKKTVSSFLSVTLVVLLTMMLVYKIAAAAKIQGFSSEQSETISYLSLDVQLDFTKIVVCEFLIGLLGAMIDIAISIASAMNELYVNKLFTTPQSLLISGINIGKDILGTMTNTLLFAFIGGFMTLVIWFSKFNYSLTDILNNKVFGAEILQVLCSGIGIVLIIPVTAIITSRILLRDKSGSPCDDSGKSPSY
ncbi:YibE/F family protein [Desulfosporosinus sp. PR]|uniref:YibE/F family protein n=1 Tax=Candidatus Desulfosporosinus nitrosoreducens TaxID=3401928 RepID=UPI0027EC543F|nr:YibE/F family protein [Desulfosporosinus sp. PR]MDQ7095191.1 YibE/F family protein [Desulfosporosinus sp. PR]